MPRTVLIGVDGSSRAEDATAVAALIAPALEARPALLYAHPYRELESLLSEGEREQLVREVAETSARQARAYFGDAEPPRLELVGNRSPAAALHAAATERDVAAIVVGSSSRGAVGRVMPGGVAQRLLSGAPCPIVVAPAGFAAGQPLGLGTIGAGFDASAEAADALGFAARIASANTRRRIAWLRADRLGARRERGDPPAEQLVVPGHGRPARRVVRASIPAAGRRTPAARSSPSARR